MFSENNKDDVNNKKFKKDLEEESSFLENLSERIKGFSFLDNIFKSGNALFGGRYSEGSEDNE